MFFTVITTTTDGRLDVFRVPGPLEMNIKCLTEYHNKREVILLDHYGNQVWTNRPK